MIRVKYLRSVLIFSFLLSSLICPSLGSAETSGSSSSDDACEGLIRCQNSDGDFECCDPETETCVPNDPNRNGYPICLRNDCPPGKSRCPSDTSGPIDASSCCTATQACILSEDETASYCKDRCLSDQVTCPFRAPRADIFACCAQGSSCEYSDDPSDPAPRCVPPPPPGSCNPPCRSPNICCGQTCRPPIPNPPCPSSGESDPACTNYAYDGCNYTCVPRSGACGDGCMCNGFECDCGGSSSSRGAN